jgi:predicted alpha/beta-hydrolase family hydrolase
VTRLFVFAPGAGAPSSHPWMQNWKRRLETLGRVVAFDYAYMRAGRRRPDPLPELVKAHRQALAEARQEETAPVILIGKSMGGRIGCHVALEDKVAGIICLGYPLCGGGDPTKLREEVLRKVSAPILFVQGTRDPLCPLDLLARTRAGMKAATELHIVEGGDHSLLVSKTKLRESGETQEDVDERIVKAIEKFSANLES